MASGRFEKTYDWELTHEIVHAFGIKGGYNGYPTYGWGAEFAATAVEEGLATRQPYDSPTMSTRGTRAGSRNSPNPYYIVREGAKKISGARQP
jgi:hypothetical protein